MTAKTKPSDNLNGQTEAMKVLDQYVYGTARMMEIPLEKLHIDPSYQREQKETLISRIVSRFDANKFELPTVNKRPDGSLFVVDGGHRLRAAKQLGMRTITCRIISISPGEEPACFIGLNRARRWVTAVETFKAELANGNAEAIEISRVLGERGLRVAASHSPQTIGCTSTLAKLYARGGTVGLCRTLDTTLKAWPHDEARRFAGQLLQGIDLFYETNARADQDRLVNRLSGVTTSHLLGKASGRWHAWKSLDRLGGSLVDATAEEITILYNKTR